MTNKNAASHQYSVNKKVAMSIQQIKNWSILTVHNHELTGIYLFDNIRYLIKSVKMFMITTL